MQSIRILGLESSKPAYSNKDTSLQPECPNEQADSFSVSHSDIDFLKSPSSCLFSNDLSDQTRKNNNKIRSDEPVT